jgi:hypothetical protein
VEIGADEVDATSAACSKPNLPRRFALRAFPNPFNPQTMLRFEIAQSGVVQLHIYTILGQRVRTLINGFRPVGSYSLIWNGRDENGRICPAGIYMARLRQKSKNIVLKLILVK